MRYSAEADANQPAILRALRETFWTVALTTRVGGGFPDLVISRGGITLLVEIKMPKATFKASQIKFYQTWAGPVFVVRSVDDVVRLSNGQYAALEHWEHGRHFQREPG